MEPIHLFVPTFRIEEVLAEIRECLERGWTGLGYKTVEIEERWRRFTDCRMLTFSPRPPQAFIWPCVCSRRRAAGKTATRSSRRPHVRFDQSRNSL